MTFDEGCNTTSYLEHRGEKKKKRKKGNGLSWEKRKRKKRSGSIPQAEIVPIAVNPPPNGKKRRGRGGGFPRYARKREGKYASI